MEREPNIQEIFQKLDAQLRQNLDRVAGVTGTLHFQLTGEGGDDYFLHLDDGKAELSRGVPEHADCTVSMDTDDFKALVTGRLNAMTALTTGKLRVKGNMSLALRLQSLLAGKG